MQFHQFQFFKLWYMYIKSFFTINHPNSSIGCFLNHSYHSMSNVIGPKIIRIMIDYNGYYYYKIFAIIGVTYIFYKQKKVQQVQAIRNILHPLLKKQITRHIPQNVALQILGAPVQNITSTNNKNNTMYIKHGTESEYRILLLHPTPTKRGQHTHKMARDFFDKYIYNNNKTISIL